MTAAAPAPAPERRHPAGRRRATLRYALAAGVGLALAALLWIAVTAALARSQAQAAEQDLSRLRAAVAQADLPAARSAANSLSAHARSAHRLTTGPAWWAGARLPWLGRPATSIRGCAAQSDQLGSAVLIPLVHLAETLPPGGLIDHGSVRLRPLIDAAPVLQQAEQRLRAGSEQVDQLPGSTWLAPADRSRASLRACPPRSARTSCGRSAGPARCCRTCSASTARSGTSSAWRTRRSPAGSAAYPARSPS